MEEIKQKYECRHRFTQVIAGPMLTVHKCFECGLEIVDVIDRGPNRMEIEPDGKVYIYGNR